MLVILIFRSIIIPYVLALLFALLSLFFNSNFCIKKRLFGLIFNYFYYYTLNYNVIKGMCFL